MIYAIAFTPEALDQIRNIEDYIADAASPAVAARYVDAIVSHCKNLARFPLRGTPRPDLRPDLRMTNYKGRIVIAFVVTTDQVTIIGVFHGAQDYEVKLLHDEKAH